MAYDPFGQIIGREGNTETPFLYVGQYGVKTDSNGLYYMRNRYYNPLIARFMNEDPIRSGLNWYAYCNNNPINNIDPLGLEYGPLGLYPNPYGQNGIADLFWGIGMGVKGFAEGAVEAGRGFNEALGDLPGGSALQIAFAFTPAGMTVDGFIIADDIINNWDDLSFEEQNMILMSILIPKPATKSVPKMKNCPDLSKANYTPPKNYVKINPNGVFKNAPYHGRVGNARKSKAPLNGQVALDNSVPLKDTTPRRVGISDGEFVVLDQTTDGVFHGHVRTWDELTRDMRKALLDADLVTKKGKIK